MMSLSDDKQADIDTFNTTSRYLNDISNINNVHFDNMVSQIYPSGLQLNKAYISDTEATFLTCICPFLMILILQKLTITVTILMFEIVNFPFLDGDVLRSLYLSTHPIC